MPPTAAVEPDRRGAPWRLALWWLASVVVAVAHNGLWATPNVAFLSAIARDFGHNPFGGRLAGDYLMTDVSLTALARLTGQDAPHALARLHLGVLVVVWAWVVWLAWRRFGEVAARTLTVVMAAAPLVTVSMQWLGQPDPLTGACGIAMVLLRRRWSVFAVAVVAGLTHPEQALFMAGAAVAAREAVRLVHPGDDAGPAAATGSTVRRLGTDALAAVGGVVTGALVTRVWFALAGITIEHPRSDYLRYGLSAFAEHHGRRPLGLAWTLWGPLWLAVGGLMVAAAVLRHHHSCTAASTGPAAPGAPGAGDVPAAPTGLRRAWWVIGVSAAVALLPVFFTLDETRVYAVITAPLLAAGAIATAAVLPVRWNVWGAAGLLVVTAVLPGGFATGVTSWRGQLDTPAMVTWLADGTLPASADGDLTAWLMSPFDFVIPELPDG